MPKNTSAKNPSFSPRFISNIKSQDWAKKATVDADKLKQKLAGHRDKAVKKFTTNHPQASKWFKQKNLDLGKIRLHSQKLLTSATLSTALLLSAPTSPKALPQKTTQARLAEAEIKPVSTLFENFVNKLHQLIPHRIGHLDPDTEETVQQLIKETFGINASSTLENQRLNHSLGWIGYEQHLIRYPGDSLNQHDEELQHGIAPGLGAWGYFASSQTELTEELKAFEKYYVAVQTLYLPNWSQDTKYLSQWYKHRKVLVVNVDNGFSVVAVIGDAGPAAWTGKQFGGSPEVMRALDLTGKKSKGKVLLYFIDDPDNKVPLGPVKGSLDANIKLT